MGFSDFVEMPQGAPILDGCFMGCGGQVIASHNLGSPWVETGDCLSTAMASILEFVERSYPTTQREPFEPLDHGPSRVLVDAGKFCMLILIVEGHEDEGLRQGMREILEGCEERHGSDLREGATGGRMRKDGQDTPSTAASPMKVVRRESAGDLSGVRRLPPFARSILGEKSLYGDPRHGSFRESPP